MNGDEVNKVIEKIVEKLGVAAEKAAPFAEMIIREYALSNLISGIMAVAGILFSVILAYLAIKVAKLVHKKSEDEFDTIVISVISIIPICFIFFSSVGTLTKSIQRFVAPHYHILQELLK